MGIMDISPKGLGVSSQNWERREAVKTVEYPAMAYSVKYIFVGGRSDYKLNGTKSVLSIVSLL